TQALGEDYLQQIQETTWPPCSQLAEARMRPSIHQCMYNPDHNNMADAGIEDEEEVSNKFILIKKVIIKDFNRLEAEVEERKKRLASKRNNKTEIQAVAKRQTKKTNEKSPTGLPCHLHSLNTDNFRSCDLTCEYLKVISPDLKNKVISTGWEIARDWLLLCSRAPLAHTVSSQQVSRAENKCTIGTYKDSVEQTA
ncbi:unnamed protein product, partial [Timema podura]|nr:unnamed protein product [Timema podura]